MFSINSFPVVYRTMLIVPNTMLMNVMACRVFRNTKFGDRWTESTTDTAPSRRGPAPSRTLAISGMAFQEPYANSSATHALSLISETDNQSRGSRGAVEDKKLGGADVIDIYSSRKKLSDLQEGRSRDGAV
jgi:hypothetical protein